MKNTLKILLASLAFVSVTSQAAIFNIGNISPQLQVPTNQFNLAAESSISDTYTFSLLSDAIFTSTVLGLGVSNFDTDLFFGLNNLNLTNTPTIFDASTVQLSSGPVLLSAGSYSFMISGTTNNVFNSTKAYIGSFTLGNPAAVAAVPEVEPYAMFLVGLGLLGFVAKRRKFVA